MALEKRKWLTISEAASKIGVSRQRMHQIIRESRLKVEAVHGRLSVIDQDEVNRLIRLRENEKK